MHWKFNFYLFTFLKFENPSSCSKVEWQFWQHLCFWLAAVEAAWLLGSSSMHRKFNSDHFTFLKFKIPSSSSKLRWQLWQQLCYQLAAVTASLVAAWLLGSSSMYRKFNSDHFTFLKFENPTRSSKVRWQFWQQLCYYLQLLQQLW